MGLSRRQVKSKATKTINSGPLLEKDTTVLTLWSVVVPPVQYSALALGTEDGQAIWYCRPGQKSQAGVVLSQNAVTACILRYGHELPLLCPLNILTYVPGQSEGNRSRLVNNSGLTEK